MEILNDPDPVEAREWVDLLKAVVQYQDVERARYLLGKLRDEAALIGARSFFTATTPLPQYDPKSPGNRDIEHRIRSAIRWNAVAIVLHANKDSSTLHGARNMPTAPTILGWSL